MTNFEQFPTKCCIKIKATLFTLATTEFFWIKCDKNVTTTGGNPVCFKKFVENELKFCDVMLLLLKIDKACCINI